MQFNRRKFLLGSAALGLGFTKIDNLLGQSAAAKTPTDAGSFGALIEDRNRMLDLPLDFSYETISKVGAQMDDGFFVPSAFGAMAAFATRQSDRVVLVRNHEMMPEDVKTGPFGAANELLRYVGPEEMYDRGGGTMPCLGGSTTVLYDARNRRVIRQYLSLAGTIRNCGGGPTPWGTWISCEQSVQPATGAYETGHGYAFEVRASPLVGLDRTFPLRPMGRFNRGGLAVDPESGIIYQSEVRDDGLIYRFIPNSETDPRTGRLQALRIVGMKSADMTNWVRPAAQVGQSLDTDWIDLKDVESPDDDLRLRGFDDGAAKFARVEGMCAGQGVIYFSAATGGPQKAGQVWRYIPRTSKLTLFMESRDRQVLDMPDDMTLSPWGDLILCENGPDGNFVVGLNSRGQPYKLARNVLNNSKLAGVAFSPDGALMFLNFHTPGLTVAITGPWERRAF